MTADTLPFHLLLLLVGVITLSSWSIISSVDGSIASFSPTSSFSYRQPPAWLLAEMAPLKGAKRHDLATVAKAHARWKRSMVDIRTLLCNRIIKQLSSFLAVNQLAGVMNVVATDYYNGKDNTTIQTDAQNFITGNLTGTQLVTGLGAYNCIQNVSSLTTLTSQLTGPLSNNLGAVLAQVNTKIASVKSAGGTQNQCIFWMYWILNEFFTKSTSCLILSRVKAQIDPTKWVAMEACLATGLVNFSTCGL